MIPYSEWKSLLAEERLPVALVDLDAFEENIRAVGEASGGKPVRLATKSLRVPEMIRRALDSGVFRGLMCFSAEEVLFLAQQGFDDLLLAYPTIRRSDREALKQARALGKTVRVVVDSKESVRELASSLERSGIDVLIDIDVSTRFLGIYLGARRSPIRTDRDILAIATEIQKHSQLKLVGAMAYEAQVAGLTDRNPFKKPLNPIARWIRGYATAKVARKRSKIRKLFELHSLSLEIFNGGGTGSLNLASSESALNELAAGSALLCPHLFDYYSNIGFKPACFFALQAAREPAPGFVTCHGGGYIASGEPGWDRLPLPYLPQGMRYVSTEGAGEVQTPLRMGMGMGTERVALGDPVLFRHAKAGELAERFNEYLLISGGKIVARAKTYRGFGLSFV
jgi:D-serine deaminase-like pyridoxal phosphate-dependent protein